MPTLASMGGEQRNRSRRLYTNRGAAGRLEERIDALTHGMDDLSGEVRTLRLRVDTMLLAMVGMIATLAIKL